MLGGAITEFQCQNLKVEALISVFYTSAGWNSEFI